MNFCPDWLFDACCGSAVDDFLRNELPSEVIAEKYASVLRDTYEGFDAGEIVNAIELMTLTLNDIEAGEEAAIYAIGFSFFRIRYKSAKEERKIKGFFSSQVDGEKKILYSAEKATKRFKAYIFSRRNSQVVAAPLGWSFAEEKEIDILNKISRKSLNILDLF